MTHGFKANPALKLANAFSVRCPAPRQPLKEFDILSVNPLAYAPELPEVVHPFPSRCQPSGF